MNIKDLKKGQNAIITHINASKNTAYTEELTSLGICEGTKITVVRTSTFGNLLHLKCNNSTIVIRKNESDIIEVISI